jgi:hypothetical protein
MSVLDGDEDAGLREMDEHEIGLLISSLISNERRLVLRAVLAYYPIVPFASGDSVAQLLGYLAWRRTTSEFEEDYRQWMIARELEPDTKHEYLGKLQTWLLEYWARNAAVARRTRAEQNS